MFILTDTTQIACHGNFPSIIAAKNYAWNMRNLDLCLTFNIGQYIDQKYVIVYDSESLTPIAQR